MSDKDASAMIFARFADFKGSDLLLMMLRWC